MGVTYAWRRAFDDDEVNALHAEAFHHPVLADSWVAQAERWSLGWVTARDADGALVGFVNVPWDGGSHAFVLDTMVATRALRRGIGTRLVEEAVAGTERRAANGSRRLRRTPRPVLPRRLRLRLDRRRAHRAVVGPGPPGPCGRPRSASPCDDRTGRDNRNLERHPVPGPGPRSRYRKMPTLRCRRRRSGGSVVRMAPPGAERRTEEG